MVLARGGHDAGGGGGADAAARRLDGAAERLRVGGVGEQREVGERVADLGALVQAEAAEHAVRDPGRGERDLHRLGRVGGAGEHEHLAGRGAGGQRVGDQARHPARLVALVREPARDHAPAGAADRDELLRRALRVVRDARGRGVEDLRARAEVASQHDPAVLRVALAEGEDVARLGAAEAVDQLVVVADAREAAVGAGEQREQRGLRRVGVLQLVDDEPAPAPAQVREPVRMLGQQPHRVDEQVVEAERVALGELDVGGAPDRRDDRGGRVPARA